MKKLIFVILILLMAQAAYAMRIPSASTDRDVAFVAVDSIDFQTRETGLSSFTVYYTLDDSGSATAMTTPTVTEVSAANMPGVYMLSIDESGMTTLTAGHDTEELVLHITNAAMAPVTRAIEIYRPETSEGSTLIITTGGHASSNMVEWEGTPVESAAIGGVPNVNIAYVSGDSAAADNLELDYDNTGYAKTSSAIGSVFDVINTAPANVVSISSDSSAANNLESMYDGSGYTDPQGPAKQVQLDQLAVTGAAINEPAESRVLTTGSETGTFANTAALDSTYHQIDPSANTIEIYYEFNIGQDGIPTGASFTGRLEEPPPVGPETVTVNAWNWMTSGWDQVGTVTGANSSLDVSDGYDLFTSHVGTGANAGKVRIQFQDAGLDNLTSLYIDQLFVSYAVVNRSVGYSNGSIWVDTLNGTAGTVSFINGTADNPVLTWADALTLSNALGMIRFQIINGSTITLSGNSDNYSLLGASWNLDLNGQSIDGIHICGAETTGIGTNGATKPSFIDCHFDDVSLPPSHICGTGIEGTITFTAAGTFFFDNCHSAVAGTNAPVIDFGAGLNASQLNFRGYSGGVEIQNMGAGTGSYDMSLEGNGQLIINANCSATSLVAIRGAFTVTDNASGAVTLNDDARYDIGQIDDTITANASVVGIIEDTGTTLPAQITSEHATTDALITSSHSTTDGKIDTTDALITSSHSTTDALITSSHSTTDGKIDTTDALITSSHSTTDALITSSHSTTDGKIDTTDALITSSHSTTDGKIDTTDALITSSHSTTDGKIDTTDALVTSSHSTTDALVTSSHSTTDGKIDTTDALITSSHSTTDGLIGGLNDLSAAEVNAEVDTALADYDGPTNAEMDTAHALLSTSAALATHDGKLDTVDGVVDSILVLATWLQNVMEGDHIIDTSPTPWQQVISIKGGGAELIRKDQKTVDDVDITSTTVVVGRLEEPP